MNSTSQQPKVTGRAFYESLGSPRYILAPMVDQSEFAWRLLTRSFLPPSKRPSVLAYTPMLHARLFKGTQSFRDHHFQPTRTGLPPPPQQSSEIPSNGEQFPYLDGHPSNDRPLIVQFCANDPDDLLQAAQHVAPYCDAVDLNLGCPQGIARKGHYGSFLQESPNLIHSLISNLAKNLDVPVTAKMRVLNTKEETLQYARLLLDAGASWIAVHGRRREQKGHETGLADWSMIRYLRDRLPKETVIFTNGNILGYGDLDRCLEATGADGVMSAEGNLCDPGIFAGDEGRKIGQRSGEYWTGKDGKGGWRMDAVMRRYLDILYTHVLEKEPPQRRPLLTSDTRDDTHIIQIDISKSHLQITPPAHQPTATTTNPNESTEPPPSKNRKGNRAPRPTSPNLLAIQAHLFHLLRPLVSKHTHIRDKLAHARPGDMHAYEEILTMVEDVTGQGLREYEQDPAAFDLPFLSAQSVIGVNGEDQNQKKAEGERKKEAEEAEESSIEAVRECHRPWWVCQAYVRPLPKEALEKGSLSLGKKAKRKIERVEEEERARKRKVDGGVEESGKVREEMDEKDGVPREEIPKEAMVCG
ncbi:MAG: hypothetical protein LQ343_000932 [Gyalolechia ehrenbergii]|nr:MAG: hypothetical protein LQ343_000932 [Gyalolechia ehrenbergii]